MRVLLRDRKTNLFWQGQDRWTANILAARDFGSSTRCIQQALSERLTGVEVVLSFEDSFYDIALPLTETTPGQRVRPR